MKKKHRLHAFDRAYERFGLYKDEAKRLISEAWSAGKTVKQLDYGPIKSWASSKQKNKKIKIYKDILFIFNKDGTCITMYKIPEKILEKEREFIMKKNKTVRSKYLGLQFLNSDGEVWTVNRVTKTSYNNYRFNLSRSADNNAIKTISVTSKTMKKLATSYLTIEDVLTNKETLRKRNVNTYRNTSWYTWSEAKSCK